MPPGSTVPAASRSARSGRDIGVILARLDAALREREFLCGALSVAELALFPHLSALKPLGIGIDPRTHPRLAAWNQRLRALPIVRADLDTVKRAAIEKFGRGASPYEGEKIAWRGDRLEWLFHHGFADWWMEELRAGRAVVPSSV